MIWKSTKLPAADQAARTELQDRFAAGYAVAGRPADMALFTRGPDEVVIALPSADFLNVLAGYDTWRDCDPPARYEVRFVLGGNHARDMLP